MKKTEQELLKELRISAKKERLNKLIQKYINQILIFVGVVIVLMLIATVNSVIVKQRQKKYSEKFYTAVESLQKNEVTKATEIFKNIYADKKAPIEIRSVSGIRLARLEAFQGNEDEAIKIYLNVYKQNKQFFFVKYLAGTSAVTLMINQKNTNNYPEIEKLLNKLVHKNNPLINLTMEQKAIFEIQKGNLEEGVKILNEILTKENLDSASEERINDLIQANK